VGIEVSSFAQLPFFYFESEIKILIFFSFATYCPFLKLGMYGAVHNKASIIVLL
jgi:hypothetical protein